ncbi:MAG: aminopeptidase [Sphaerochaeta sp.]
MEQYLERYVRLIIDVQLKLIEGDNLSINTGGRSMGFARLLAQEATIATRLPVTIVETAGGKVIQAYPIDPKEKDLFRPEPAQAVMCRIVDLDDFPYDEEESLIDICRDAASLSAYGVLADPIFLDRRIGSPWANIPYPGPRWAEAEIGHNVLEREAWEYFAKLLRLDSEHASSFWTEQANLLSWRKKRLDAIGDAQVRLTGDGWALTARMAEHTHFSGGPSALASGRAFIPTLPMQSMVGSLAADSASGTVAASRSFTLLGTVIEGAVFTIESGVVTSWDAAVGKDTLDAFFGVDEGAKGVSSVLLADTNTIESHSLTVGVHPHFSDEVESAISFGGFVIETLDREVDEELLPQCKLCDSLVRMTVPIGNNHLQVAFTAEGEEIVMMEEGVFNE